MEDPVTCESGAAGPSTRSAAILLGVVLLTVVFQPGGAKVRIVDPPRSGGSLRVGAGQAFALSCRPSHPSTPLRWHLNGAPIASDHVFTVAPPDGRRGNQVTLTVTHASAATSGRYQCTNQRDLFDYDFRRVNVAARRYPLFSGRRVDITQPPDTSTSVGEGGALSLKCEGGATTELLWYHDDHRVDSDARVLVSSAENATLDVATSVITVMNVEQADAGLYVCQDAGNYQNADIVNVTIVSANISHDVRITDPHGVRAIFTKGRILTAKCRGNENRLLEWRHNGLPVQPNSRVVVTWARLTEEQVVETQIRVHALEAEDAGVYQCRDRADLLQRDAFKAVVVTPRKDTPVVITSPALHEAAVPPGGTFRATCVSAANTGLRWRRNGQPLTRGPQVDVVTSRQRADRTVTSVLTVLNMTLMTTGRYTCEDVRDELNYQELDVSLSEDSVPITLFIEEPKTSYVSVMPGGYLVIRCVGPPNTHIQWRHNGQLLDPGVVIGYVVTRMLDMRDGTIISMLSAFGITSQESGVFTCEDKEDFRNSASIGVRVPRLVNITTGALVLHRGDPFRLVCEADSGTDLQWVRGDDELLNPITEGMSVRTADDALQGMVTSVLHLTTIANHSGEYTCRDGHYQMNSDTVTVSYEEVQQKLLLEITTPHTTVGKEGSKLIMRCRATAGVKPFWTKNDVELSNRDDVFVMTTTMTSGDQWLSVILNPLTLLSSGVYECKDRGGRVKTDRSFLVVQPSS